MSHLTGYKIIRIWNRPEEKPIPATRGGYSYIEHDCEVTYLIGEPVTRPNECGPLTVFKSKAAAVAFFYEDKLHEAIQGSGVMRGGELGPDYWDILGTQLYSLWKCKYLPSNDDTLWTPMARLTFVPTGTAFADEVVLKKRLYFPSIETAMKMFLRVKTAKGVPNAK